MRSLRATKPNLFIVGQPRSGTSALYQFLKEHPEVFMSKIKEPEYFSKDMESFHFEKSKIRRTDENYIKFFKDCKHEKIVGEASTNYLYSKVAAKEICQFNPSAKIIVMIREPVAFLRSYHSYRLRPLYEQENIRDFVKALASETERKLGKNIPKNCLNPSMLYYSERVKYSEQIRRYYNTFDKAQVKIIVYDDFKKDNAEVYKDVLRFVGIQEDFAPEFKIVNPSATVRFKTLKVIREAEHYLKIRTIAKLVIPKKVFPLLKRLYDNTLLNFQAPPSLDPSVRTRLMGKYKKEVEEVSRLLNRDLVRLWGYE